MSALPRVSVIIPVLNAERDLRTSLTTLLAMDYPRELLEILVVDNGSTDGTRDVAREFPVTLMIEDGAKNAYTARNAAVRKASGAILAFTDGDCVVDRKWLRAGLAAMERHQAQLVGGRVVFTFPGGHTPGAVADSLLHLDNERWVTTRGCAVTANLITYAGVFGAVGLFPDDVPIGGDFKWTAAAVAQGYRIVYAPEAIVHHPAREFRALLRKGYSIGRVYAQWPGLQGRTRPATLWRLAASCTPPRPGWVRRLLERRGTLDMGRRRISLWWVLWLYTIWWATGAIASLLRGRRELAPYGGHSA